LFVLCAQTKIFETVMVKEDEGQAMATLPQNYCNSVPPGTLL
jgi:hypothetical protein